MQCPVGALLIFVLVWFCFVPSLWVLFFFFFCVVQSGMGASSQCLFPEAGGVEGEGIEYPNEGPDNFPLFVLRE